MRDYGSISPRFWIDFRGQEWPVVNSTRRLKFKYPSHAALRAHVFHRDGFQCKRCDARAEAIPADYTGESTIRTNTFTGTGWPDLLVVDHILTLKAGGRNVIDNFQTLCETCNRRKQREDKVAVMAMGAP